MSYEPYRFNDRDEVVLHPYMRPEVQETLAIQGVAQTFVRHWCQYYSLDGEK